MGRSGVGRLTAVTLVAHLHRMKLFSPNLSRNYGLKCMLYLIFILLFINFPSCSIQKWSQKRAPDSWCDRRTHRACSWRPSIRGTYFRWIRKQFIGWYTFSLFLLSWRVSVIILSFFFYFFFSGRNTRALFTRRVGPTTCTTERPVLPGGFPWWIVWFLRFKSPSKPEYPFSLLLFKNFNNNKKFYISYGR